MMVGGIDPHRHDLSSMVMLKDNHVWASGEPGCSTETQVFCSRLTHPEVSGPPGSITKAIETLRRAAGFSLLVTIECQSYDEAAEALDAGANIVMLDNMVGNDLHDCARELKRVYGKQGKGREFLIESSGGVVEDGLVARIGPDIDILSTSAVHQVRSGRRKPTPTVWRSCGRCVLTATASAGSRVAVGTARRLFAQDPAKEEGRRGHHRQRRGFAGMRRFRWAGWFCYNMHRKMRA
jgi:hypothetical protein